MHSWLFRLQQLCQKGQPCVLVSVAGTRGSAPRETGAKMIVTEEQTIGTIGGGELEYQCTEIACEWLRGEPGTGRSHLRKFTLGANCGQCCGGVVEILFEEITTAQRGWVNCLYDFYNANTAALMLTARQSRNTVGKLIITADDCFGDVESLGFSEDTLADMRATLEARACAQPQIVSITPNIELPVLTEPVKQSDFHVAIFGAGHVGSACATLLSGLDTRIDFIDTRKAVFNESYPHNINIVVAGDPVDFIARLPGGCFCLVMTHDHALDLRLCAALLQRDDLSFYGLIGSVSKRRRFVKRLTAMGLSNARISPLVCPIGTPEISGKKPAEIAIAVAAQLVALREQLLRTGSHASRPLVANVNQLSGRS